MSVKTMKKTGLKKKYSSWREFLEQNVVDFEKYRLHNAYDKCSKHRTVKVAVRSYEEEVDICCCGAIVATKNGDYYNVSVPYADEVGLHLLRDKSESSIKNMACYINVAIKSEHWNHEEVSRAEFSDNEKLIRIMYEQLRSYYFAAPYHALVNRSDAAFLDAISRPELAMYSAKMFPELFNKPEVRTSACNDADTATQWATEVDKCETPESRAAQRTHDDLCSYIWAFRWAKVSRPTDVKWPAPLTPSEEVTFNKKRTKESAIKQALFNRRPSKRLSKILRDSSRYFLDYCLYALGEPFRDEDGTIRFSWTSWWDTATYNWLFMVEAPEGILRHKSFKGREEVAEIMAAKITEEQILSMKYSASRTMLAFAYMMYHRKFTKALGDLVCKNQSMSRLLRQLLDRLYVVNDTRERRGLPLIKMDVEPGFREHILSKDPYYTKYGVGGIY